MKKCSMYGPGLRVEWLSKTAGTSTPNKTFNMYLVSRVKRGQTTRCRNVNFASAFVVYGKKQRSSNKHTRHPTGKRAQSKVRRKGRKGQTIPPTKPALTRTPPVPKLLRVIRRPVRRCHWSLRRPAVENQAREGLNQVPKCLASNFIVWLPS